jgi:hypothetical protein
MDPFLEILRVQWSSCRKINILTIKFNNKWLNLSGVGYYFKDSYLWDKTVEFVNFVYWKDNRNKSKVSK